MSTDCKNKDVHTSDTSNGDRLKRARQVREEMIVALREKIAALKAEKAAMDAMYDEEIGELDVELRELLPSALTEHPTDAGVLAFNYLKANPGEWVRPADLLREIRREGVVAAVVLSPFLRDGRVKKTGEKRGTMYMVEAA